LQLAADIDVALLSRLARPPERQANIRRLTRASWPEMEDSANSASAAMDGREEFLRQIVRFTES